MNDLSAYYSGLFCCMFAFLFIFCLEVLLMFGNFVCAYYYFLFSALMNMCFVFFSVSETVCDIFIQHSPCRTTYTTDGVSSCVYACMCVCVHAHMCVCVSFTLYVIACVCVCVCVYVCVFH